MNQKEKINIGILLLLVLFIAQGCNNNSSFKIIDATCDHLTNPTGINTLKPRFSWKNISSKQGEMQTAYQILVATDINKLSEKDADIWNSGKTQSSENILIEYNGEPLSSRQVLYWRVRTWNRENERSKWSDVAHFSIGLLEKSDWKAAYIGYPMENGFQNSPQFRKSFFIKKIKNDEKYFLHINSLGYHEIYINGEKVDDHILSPAVSQFNKRSLINTYEVTSYLSEGENNLVIWMGSGWYSEGLPGVTGDGPTVRAQLEKLTNKSHENIIVTDDTWTARNSEYKRISDWRSGRYGGEEITGNLEEQNIALLNPDNLTWNKVKVIEIADHTVIPQMVEPNRIQETLKPVKIDKLNDSTYIVDMGKNISGWFEITFPKLEKTQRVELEYSDLIEDSGDLAWQGQKDLYIASGSGTEFFKNKFNYHGFRYVKIKNIKQAPEKEKIKAHLIHTDFDLISKFECSDTEFNQIHDMVFYTLRCLSLGGYLVDCPQIERLGYGGDGNASTMTAQTMFSLAPLYNNWLDVWTDVIREDGSMPHTAPNPYAAGGGPYWCGFIISAAWQTYQNYGDLKVLEKYYPTMQKWLEYVDNHIVDGLLKRWPDTDYRVWYLGDWATPTGVDQTNEKSVDLVSNCYLSVCYDQMKNITSVLGYDQESSIYSQKKDKLNKKIHDTFYIKEKGIYGTGSQIDMVYPMLVNATPSSLKDQIISNLFNITEEKYNGHLTTGLVGVPVIMEWATNNNQSDFVYSMLKKKDYPGYLYMLENGATTTWEHWNGERSRIHNCYNGVGQWFYQSIGGIVPIEGKPAYSEFLIDPQTVKNITWAKTQIETPKGLLCVNWNITNNQMKMEVEIPVGSIAKLNYPKNTTEIRINSDLVKTSGIQLELQSGKHSIEYSI